VKLGKCCVHQTCLRAPSPIAGAQTEKTEKKSRPNTFVLFFSKEVGNENEFEQSFTLLEGSSKLSPPKSKIVRLPLEISSKFIRLHCPGMPGLQLIVTPQPIKKKFRSKSQCPALAALDLSRAQPKNRHSGLADGRLHPCSTLAVCVDTRKYPA